MSDVPASGSIMAVGGRGGFAVVDTTSLTPTYLAAQGAKRAPVVKKTIDTWDKGPGSADMFVNVCMNGELLVCQRSKTTVTSRNVRDPGRKGDAGVSQEVKVYHVGSKIGGDRTQMGAPTTVKLAPKGVKSVRLLAVDVAPKGDRFCAVMGARYVKKSEAKAMSKGLFSSSKGGRGGPSDSRAAVRLAQYSVSRTGVGTGLRMEYQLPSYVASLRSAVVKYSNSTSDEGAWLCLAVNPHGTSTSSKREILAYPAAAKESSSTMVPRKVDMPFDVTCMDFTSDDSILAVGMADGHAIALVGTVDWVQIGAIAMECKAVWSIAFSHPVDNESKVLAAIGTLDATPTFLADSEQYRSFEGIAFLCDFKRKECIAKLTEGPDGLPIPGGFNKVCAFTPDSHLVLSDTKGNILKYDIMGDEQKRASFLQQGGVSAMAMSGPVSRSGDRWVAFGVIRNKVSFALIRHSNPVPSKDLDSEYSTTEIKTSGEEATAFAFAPNNQLVVIALSKAANTPPTAKGGRRSSFSERSSRTTRLQLRGFAARGDDLKLAGSSRACPHWGLLAENANVSIVGEVHEIKWVKAKSTQFAVALPGEIQLFHATKLRTDRTTLKPLLTFLASRPRPQAWVGSTPGFPYVHFLKRTETKNEISVMIEQKRLSIGDGIKQPQSIACNARGTVMAIGGEKVVVFFDVPSKESIGRISVPGVAVVALAFSDDDRMLAAGGNTGTLFLIDVQTQLILNTLQEKAFSPRSIAFSPDGSYILTSSGAFSTITRRDTANIDRSNTRFAVWSIDGSHEPLIQPVDASTMLASKVLDVHLQFNQARAKALGEIVEEDPSIAYTVVPPREKIFSSRPSAGDKPAERATLSDPFQAAYGFGAGVLNTLGIGGSSGASQSSPADVEDTYESEQWLKPDVEKDLVSKGIRDPQTKLRMIDVLVGGRETEAVKAVLATAPALSIVPLYADGKPFLPSFNIAVRVRATSALQQLLLASARAPVMLRGVVAEHVLPVLVNNGMTGVVASVLSELELEASGSAVRYAVDKSGYPLSADETLELHETWGGDGTLVWLNYDPDPAKLRQAKRLKNMGASSRRSALFEQNPVKELPEDASAFRRAYAWTVHSVRRVAFLIVATLSLLWGTFLQTWSNVVHWWLNNMSYERTIYRISLLGHYMRVGLYRFLGLVESVMPYDTLFCIKLPHALQGANLWVKELRDDIEPSRPRAPPTRESNVGRPGEAQVVAQRVPWPYLSSKKNLYLMRDMPEGAFDNKVMSRTVRALWKGHFFALHVFKTALTVATAALYFVFAEAVHSGYRSTMSGQTSLLTESSADYYYVPTPVAMTYAGWGILALSAYATFSALFQLYGAIEAYGSDIFTGVISGTLEYLLNGWNLTELLGIAFLASSVYGEFYNAFEIYTGHINVAGLLSCAGLFTLVRCVQVMRGYETTGWLIMALIQNIRDMVGFMLVIGIIIAFFSVSFMSLFPVSEVARRRLEGGEDAGIAPFQGLSVALLQTFDMGLFGDFDTNDFDESISPAIAKVLFIFFMLITGVVALNALIALLGDSYAHVQEQKGEQSLRLYATCIVEYYNSMGPILRAQRERQLAWTHILRLDADDDDIEDNEWSGQLSILKKEIANRSDRLDAQVEKLAAALETIGEKVNGIYQESYRAKLKEEAEEKRKKDEEARRERAKQEEALQAGYAGRVAGPGSVAGSVAETEDLDDYDDVDDDESDDMPATGGAP